MLNNFLNFGRFDVDMIKIWPLDGQYRCAGGVEQEGVGEGPAEDPPDLYTHISIN